MPDTSPLIGVTACLRPGEAFPSHAVGDKYVDGALAAGGVPVLVPAIGDALDADALLARLDGLLLTGSPSNVAPHHYGGAAPPAGGGGDPARDATTLPLIRKALAQGVPLLAICRGHQELNVALGGTLHQEVHALDGRLDHRSDKRLPPDGRYEPRHEVILTPGGRLHGLFGVPRLAVNSLHGQAIDRLAAGLAVEAVAEDGTVEAVSVEGAPAFALGVQWHPEWRSTDNPVSRRLFAAFGAACRRRARSRHERARELA